VLIVDLMVILLHVCNFASVEVFNKALLTYLVTYCGARVVL